MPTMLRKLLWSALYGGIALVALIRNRRYIVPALTAPFRSPLTPGRIETALGPQIERIEQDDRPAGASVAAAGYSPPRTRS